MVKHLINSPLMHWQARPNDFEGLMQHTGQTFSTLNKGRGGVGKDGKIYEEQTLK